jgi:PIN domain nuclease of toxin-antitoxin system
MKALLDTHVLLRWFAASDALSPRQRRVIDAASASEPLLISDITFWEVATLHELGRIKLSLPLATWLERVAAVARLAWIGISPAVAAEVAALPATFHRDPADRIIVASARVHGAALLTQDERIIKADLVETIA